MLVPETLRTRSILEVLRRPTLHRLKAALVVEPGIQVLDIPVVEQDIDPLVDESQLPTRHDVVVLVAGANNPVLQAVEFAKTLQPATIRAVSFGLDPEETERIGDEWLNARIPYPLEIDDSPFRDIGSSLVSYVRALNPDGVHKVVTVVIPEIALPKRRHQILHGKTPLIVKRHLLFERGVVTVSVPFHVDGEERSSLKRPAPAEA